MLVLSDDEVSPFSCESCVGAGESNRGVNAILVKLPIEAFEGCGEDRAGVKVNTGFGRAETETELGEEFLFATTCGRHHG